VIAMPRKSVFTISREAMKASSCGMPNFSVLLVEKATSFISVDFCIFYRHYVLPQKLDFPILNKQNLFYTLRCLATSAAKNNSARK